MATLCPSTLLMSWMSSVAVKVHSQSVVPDCPETAQVCWLAQSPVRQLKRG
jgi:hypothetical protein